MRGPLRRDGRGWGIKAYWGRALTRNLWRALALAGTVTALAPGVASAKTYIVQLKAPPLAAYPGGTKGLGATSPVAAGDTKLNTKSTAARSYLSYLKDRQDA